MSKLNAISRASTTLLLFAFGVAVVLGSESGMYLAMGSDVGATSYSPSLELKLLSLSLFTGAIGWSVVSNSMKWKRGFVVCIGLITLALGTHTVIFNNLDGEIQEFWLLAKLSRASYNVAEGVGFDWEVHEKVLGVTLVNKSSGESVFVFSGLPPWHVDISPLLD